MIESIDQIANCSVHGSYMKSLGACPRCDKSPEMPKTGANSGSYSLKGTNTQKPLKRGLLSYSEYSEKYTRSSKTEYERYKYLWACMQDGTITNLKCQPPFDLLPSVKLKANILRKKSTQRKITYTADFEYSYCGIRVIEDVKSTYGNSENNRRLNRVGEPIVSDVSRLRHKMLQAMYPDMVFKIVTNTSEAIEQLDNSEAA